MQQTMQRSKYEIRFVGNAEKDLWEVVNEGWVMATANSLDYATAIRDALRQVEDKERKPVFTHNVALVRVTNVRVRRDLSRHDMTISEGFEDLEGTGIHVADRFTHYLEKDEVVGFAVERLKYQGNGGVLITSGTKVEFRHIEINEADFELQQGGVKDFPKF